jgi:flagellar basal-body rod protein FlgC
MAPQLRIASKWSWLWERSGKFHWEAIAMSTESASKIFGAMNTSLSAMQAQRRRMDVIAMNLANAESTRQADGTPGPYRRQQVVFESVLNEAQGFNEDPSTMATGVRVSEVIKDIDAKPIMVHMPGHPDADANGNVLMPNVNPAMEMADMIGAARSYEANAAALKISRMMMQRSLDIGKNA